MTKKIILIYGFVFVWAALFGFIDPQTGGAYPRAIPHLIHLATGILALYLGWKSSDENAAKFSLIAGALYLFVGFLGFAFGRAYPVSQWNEVLRDSLVTYDDRWLKVIPGWVALKTRDHVFHLFMGGLLFFGRWAGGLYDRKENQKDIREMPHLKTRGSPIAGKSSAS